MQGFVTLLVVFVSTAGIAVHIADREPQTCIVGYPRNAPPSLGERLGGAAERAGLRPLGEYFGLHEVPLAKVRPARLVPRR